MPIPKARMTPIDESRSPCRAPNKAMSPATTTEPTRAPTTGLFAISSPAAAPVKASSAVPCTAKAIPLVDHERADEAAADRDERGRQQCVLGERLLKQETEAHQRWCPSGERPAWPSCRSWSWPAASSAG